MILYLIFASIIAIIVFIALNVQYNVFESGFTAMICGAFFGALLWGVLSLVWPYHEETRLLGTYDLKPIVSPVSGYNYGEAALSVDDLVVLYAEEDEKMPTLKKVSISSLTTKSGKAYIEVYGKVLIERNLFEIQLGAIQPGARWHNVYVPQEKLEFIDFNF